ncbi:MAG: ribosome silencing factor [Smithella sp.]|nr:ribosome silencing factor [Syntrophaceae bacterium]
MPAKNNESTHRLLLCINAILQKKAKDIVVLNIKEISAFADYMIICSGATERQNQALCSAIQQYMKKESVLPLGVEGEAYGQWILLDYDDVVISIFLESVRSFYDIENLWDVPRANIDENVTEIKQLPKGM